MSTALFNFGKHVINQYITYMILADFQEILAPEPLLDGRSSTGGELTSHPSCSEVLIGNTRTYETI